MSGDVLERVVSHRLWNGEFVVLPAAQPGAAHFAERTHELAPADRRVLEWHRLAGSSAVEPAYTAEAAAILRDTEVKD